MFFVLLWVSTEDWVEDIGHVKVRSLLAVNVAFCQDMFDSEALITKWV